MRTKESQTDRRKRRVRYQVRQKANGKPRLSVFRTAKHMYAQLIDDVNGRTIVSASTAEKELKAKIKTGGNVEAAKLIGQLIAERAKKEKVEKVVFDRGAYIYHGRVKALADAAREAGLVF